MIFRYARHTNQLENIINFYTGILDFEILGRFNDHNQYNGVFLGHKDSDWHLEFTESVEQAEHSFDEDDLLVFYPATLKEYDHLIRQLNNFNINKEEPKNPYWKNNGVMFLDPDNFRIVLSHLKCK